MTTTCEFQLRPYEHKKLQLNYIKTQKPYFSGNNRCARLEIKELVLNYNTTFVKTSIHFIDV